MDALAAKCSHTFIKLNEELDGILGKEKISKNGIEILIVNRRARKAYSACIKGIQ